MGKRLKRSILEITYKSRAGHVIFFPRFAGSENNMTFFASLFQPPFIYIYNLFRDTILAP